MDTDPLRTPFATGLAALLLAALLAVAAIGATVRLADRPLARAAELPRVVVAVNGADERARLERAAVEAVRR